jgi:hypothetical protein
VRSGFEEWRANSEEDIEALRRQHSDVSQRLDPLGKNE